jgi:hypothetical protein
MRRPAIGRTNVIKHTDYREWTIRATPKSNGQNWTACAEVERGTGKLNGASFVFSDLGAFATAASAADRATAWAKRWIDENFG